MVRKSIVMAGIIVMLLASSSCSYVTYSLLNKVPLTMAKVEGEKLYLMQEFNSRSYKQVVEKLDENPHVKSIVLTANGGSIDDETTFKLAREIRRRKLNTYLLSKSVIASGAVDLFLSGTKRTIEKGAKIGVHSWSNGFKEAKEYPRDSEEHELNATYIRDMLGKDDFYWYTIYAAPADSIYWMKENEVKKFGLGTEYVKSSSSWTPFGKEFSEGREELLP